MKQPALLSVSTFILVSLALCAASAQEHSVTSDSIYSHILKEQRSLKIIMPETYKPGSTERYEVIYITDGEWGTNLFSYIYGFAQGEHYVPPVIIVGIPNRYMGEANQRDRDFLPVHIAQPAISGGAGEFLTFIKNELIPYVDKKYPTNGTNSIYGHSYGGLFVLYALLAEPNLFEAYYATDPPFRWNNDFLITRAAAQLNKLSSDKILWIAGIESTYKDQGIDRLDSVLQRVAPTKLHWKMVTYLNEKHNSVRLKAMYDGIKFVYSGYSGGPPIFHPMNGIVLKDKPISVWVESQPELRYTTDGTEPDRGSQKIDGMLTLAGGAQLVVKSFSNSGKYDKTTRGNFILGDPLRSSAKPANARAGGLRYLYYEGNWEKLPDFRKLNPVKTGIADSSFTVKRLPEKEHFACLFEGYFEIPEDGYYIFALVSDDGSRLYIGDKLIVDNDGARFAENVQSFVLPLVQGFYPVRLEYFQKEGGSVLQLMCVRPGAENPGSFPLKYQYYEE